MMPVELAPEVNYRVYVFGSFISATVLNLELYIFLAEAQHSPSFSFSLIYGLPYFRNKSCHFSLYFVLPQVNTGHHLIGQNIENKAHIKRKSRIAQHLEITRCNKPSVSYIQAEIIVIIIKFTVRHFGLSLFYFSLERRDYVFIEVCNARLIWVAVLSLPLCLYASTVRVCDCLDYYTVTAKRVSAVQTNAG